MAYEERFVAFLDILGFKEIIKTTSDNQYEYDRVRRVLNYISGIRTENYEGMFSKYGILKEISVFSDSIVISYSGNLSIGGSLFHVLMDIVHISNDLLNENIFVRGGVAYGEMYHDKNVCFGPAMIKAYLLEEKIAVYPRIIVDKDAIRMGLERPGLANTIEMEAEYLKNLLCTDKAGNFYIDFLSQWQEFDEEEIYNDYLINVKNYITDHLSKNYPSKVYKKYLWFAKYYNRTLKRIYKKPFSKTMKIDLT